MRSGLASSVGVQAGGLGDHFQGCGWMCQSDGHKTCPFEDTGGSTRRPVSPSPLPATQCISQRRGSWPLQVSGILRGDTVREVGRRGFTATGPSGLSPSSATSGRVTSGRSLKPREAWLPLLGP